MQGPYHEGEMTVESVPQPSLVGLVCGVKSSFDEHWETSSTLYLYRLDGRLSTGNRVILLCP